MLWQINAFFLQGYALGLGGSASAIGTGLAKLPAGMAFVQELLAAKTGTQGFKSLGSAGRGFDKVLQSGGQALKPNTLKALNLTKDQGRNAIHALKDDLNLPNNFHGRIMGNGDYLHPSTGKWLGNLFDYVH